MDLSSLFKNKENTSNVESVNSNISSYGSYSPSNNDKNEKETYKHWGLRTCAIVSGSSYVLPVYLRSAFNLMYNEQVNNQEEQNRKVIQLQGGITQENNNLDAMQEDLTSCRNDIENSKSKISELISEKNSIIRKGYQVNKDAKMKMIIGLLVLLPITIYLFLFYSSTFYSAFFRRVEDVKNVFTSMFDPNALAISYNTGIMQLLLILSAPVIFLGLGYLLHYFSIQKEKSKYLKMGIVVVFTFMFDCLLAFLIGKSLHNLAVIIGSLPQNDVYGISQAVEDPNIWAVIFCGFVVYMIWGLVFDMVMTAYDKLDLNRSELRSIEQKQNDIEVLISNLKQEIKDKEEKITKKKNDIVKMNSQITNKVWIDYRIIKKEMTNFFSGWIAQMAILGQSYTEQDEAKKIFNDAIETLIPNKE